MSYLYIRTDTAVLEQRNPFDFSSVLGKFTITFNEPTEAIESFYLRARFNLPFQSNEVFNRLELWRVIERFLRWDIIYPSLETDRVVKQPPYTNMYNYVLKIGGEEVLKVYLYQPVGYYYCYYYYYLSVGGLFSWKIPTLFCLIHI